MNESFTVRSETGSFRVNAAFLVVAYSILAALVVLAVEIVKKRTSAAAIGLPEELMPWQGLALVVAGVLVVTVMMRRLRARVVWELILGVALFLGVWFYAWVLFPGGPAIALAALLTFLQGAVRRAIVHNAFILIGTAGTALNLAFILPDTTLLIILVGLAIYDSFAGRSGGVVAEFAASLVHRGIIPGLIIPGRWRDAFADIHSAVRRADASLLGAGDLILPITLVARAAAEGIDRAFAVAAGILIAAGWLGNRGPVKPYPALVPLAAGAAIPYMLLIAFRQL
ncbi:MAG TPA: hypothetical protein VN397_04950 [Candidatus Methylomirabilis sp.]|nr:hypothetical protein [Candidatus Methylomirabilis sp.]